MYDEDLERYKLACVIDGTELPADKKIKNNLIHKINKAMHLQEMLNSIDAKEFTKDELPYYPTSMKKFCEWEDNSFNLESFGRSTFVNQKKDRDKILETERVKIFEIANKLMKLLSDVKMGTASLTQQVKKLREQKQQLKDDKAALVSQLLEIQATNKRLDTKIKSLYADNDRLEGEHKNRLATVHQLGERS